MVGRRSKTIETAMHENGKGDGEGDDGQIETSTKGTRETAMHENEKGDGEERESRNREMEMEKEMEKEGEGEEGGRR
ncbi:hypothetical protein ACLOJK_031233 [Asimina triloba]